MLHKQIGRIEECDLAIFISPNAVRYGMEAIRTAAVAYVGAQPVARSSRATGCAPTVSSSFNEVGLPPSLKIATIGQGSANALRELGVTNVIAPTERFDSESLLALPVLQDVSGWRVMIFRGDGGRELLGDTLKARGAAVEYVTCYQRIKPQQDIRKLLDAKPDAITVTSSEALGNLLEMLDSKDRKKIFDMPLFAPHERITRLAAQQGWRNVQLTGAGDDGLMLALIAWANRKLEKK